MTIEQAKDIYKALGLRVSLFHKGEKSDDGIYEAAFPGVDELSVAIGSLHNIYFKHGGLDRIWVWSAKPSEGKEWEDVGTARYKAADLVSLCREIRQYNRQELFKVAKGIL